MNNKTWKKITDPKNWPELKSAKWTKNAFCPFMIDTKIKTPEGLAAVCYDKSTKEFFIFC